MMHRTRLNRTGENAALLIGRATRAAVVVALLGTAACATIPGREAAKPAPKAQPTRSAAEVYLVAGESAVRDGDMDRALAAFARAIEVNPRLTSAHMGMADIYRMRGEFARAEESYGQAAKLQPRSFDPQYYHGLMLHLMDRVAEAVQAYLRALAIRPNDFRSNLNLATAYYQLDENALALPYAVRAVEIEPRDGSARFNLGAVYAAMGRHREAVQEYQQATELLDLTPPLLMNLAESLGKLERYEEMVNALAQVNRVGATAASQERTGYAQFKMGRYDDALSSFDAALAIDADYFPALNGRGVCLLNKWLWSGRQDNKSREDGLASLRRSLQIRRDQPQIVDLMTRYGR
ncbi:MAG: tetratricopeptide repeat protein [Phycisphaeraceae bacterium]|nr:tetratricopeptide repeat protein [Phycisphaeraceae bacterium]